MCGRFSQSDEDIRLKVGGYSYRLTWQPRFNIAPSQEVSVLVGPGGIPVEERMKWGFVPTWAQDKTLAPINARSESAGEKPMFRQSLKSKRCLIPSCGWFEWQAGTDGKQPYRLKRGDGSTMFFAGIWTDASKSSEVPEKTFAIMTREASPEVSDIHDRMPVVLNPLSLLDWLTEGGSYEQALHNPLLTGFTFHPVSNLVSYARNESPDVIRPWGG